nr:hypothetical protein [Lachnospiraceae bacterium]
DPISPTVREKKYYYAITDVTSDSGASSAFKSDVLIEIDPTKYKASGGGISSNSALHNDKDLADLSSMDTTKDAFFLEPGGQVEKALEELRNNGSTIVNPGNLSRKITVEVNDASPYKEVVYRFVYKDQAGIQTADEYPNSSLNTLRFNSLENIYLFYMPSYSTAGDEIEFVNNTSDKYTFTVVKRQITADDDIKYTESGVDKVYTMDDVDALYNAESTYTCVIKVTDTNTTLRTNADTNLSFLIMPSTDPRYKSKGILAENDDYAVDNTLRLPNVSFVPTSLAAARNSVAGAKDGDRIYGVKIRIYKAGTIKQYLSGGGTGEFPESKRLITLDGDMD